MHRRISVMLLPEGLAIQYMRVFPWDHTLRHRHPSPPEHVFFIAIGPTTPDILALVGPHNEPFSKYLSKNGKDMSSTFFQKVCIISLLLSFNQLKTCI